MQCFLYFFNGLTAWLAVSVLRREGSGKERSEVWGAETGNGVPSFCALPPVWVGSPPPSVLVVPGNNVCKHGRIGVKERVQEAKRRLASLVPRLIQQRNYGCKRRGRRRSAVHASCPKYAARHLKPLGDHRDVGGASAGSRVARRRRQAGFGPGGNVLVARTLLPRRAASVELPRKTPATAVPGGSSFGRGGRRRAGEASAAHSSHPRGRGRPAGEELGRFRVVGLQNAMPSPEERTSAEAGGSNIAKRELAYI